MKTVEAIQEAIRELDELARVENDRDRFVRLCIILQELEKAVDIVRNEVEINTVGC